MLALRRKLLNICEALRVVLHLRVQPSDICGRLFVIRFQYLGLLARRGQRRPQLRDLVLKRRRVDLKQNIILLDRHIRLDRNGHDLTGHIRRHLDDPAGDRDLARRRQVIKQREKRRENEGADKDRDRSR